MGAANDKRQATSMSMAGNDNPAFQEGVLIGIISVYHVLITKKVSEYGYDLGVKDQCQIFLTSVSLLKTQNPFYVFDARCSYLAQWLLIVRLLQQSKRSVSHVLQFCLPFVMQIPLSLFDGGNFMYS